MASRLASFIHPDRRAAARAAHQVVVVRVAVQLREGEEEEQDRQLPDRVLRGGGREGLRRRLTRPPENSTRHGGEALRDGG